MDSKKLKRLYGAARKLRDHATLEDAAPYVGKSKSMIDKVINDTATSAPTEKAILDYCYKAGLERNIRALGLDPKNERRI